MRNTNKKGFTIVELVIVVAVIAILAAVLIPTFSGIIRKANVSKDNQLIKHLNTALEADVNSEHITPTDAFNAAAEFGFDVAKISAKANGNKILWDSVNDVFCYFNSDKNKVEYLSSPKISDVDDIDYWTVASAPSDVYSTYLFGYEGDGTENISTGLDVGECVLSKINYASTAAQNVIIRTNNAFGKLVINAPQDEVAHYGEIGDLDIIAVKMGSYTEHGAVNGVATLTYGKINVSGEGKISVIIADPVNTADVKLDVASGGQVGAVFANNDAVVNVLNVSGVKNAEVVEEGDLEELYNKVCFVKNESGVVYYDDIQTAINEATGETTIVLMKSIRYDNVTKTAISISAGKKIILDLNGNVIEARLDNTKSVNLINVSGSTSGEDVYAELTVKDSSAGSNGIGSGELRTTELYNSDPMDVSASVISVNRNGKVVIESGKIVNNNTNCAWGAYAIDVLTNTGAQNAWLTVNGGLVESKTYRAVRAFCNSTTGTVYITVNGGTVRSNGNNAIWMQSPSDKVNLGVLKITGGSIESNGYVGGEDRIPITFASGGCDTSGLTKEITGGQLLQNGKDVTANYK